MVHKLETSASMGMWEILKRTIANLQYTEFTLHSIYYLSIDENIGTTNTTSADCPIQAKRVVEVLGANKAKRLLKTLLMRGERKDAMENIKLSTLLINSFTWSESNEGYEYWDDIYYTLNHRGL